jgi:hypothetical protein
MAEGRGGDLGHTGVKAIRHDRHLDVSGLEAIDGRPTNREVVDAHDLQDDVELESLSPWAVEMLMEPEPGPDHDTVPFDQLDPFDIGAPLRVVPRIRDVGEYVLG